MEAFRIHPVCRVRYIGLYNDKLISSSNNWFIGHASNGIGKYYFNGWVDQGFDSDLNFHLFEVSHEGIDPFRENDPIARVWNDGVTGSYTGGSKQGSDNDNFLPHNLIFGIGAGQIGEFILFISEIEENDRTLIEGYLAHKWGIKLPTGHAWYSEAPIFGDIVTSGVTHVGTTGTTLAPVAVNFPLPISPKIRQFYPGNLSTQVSGTHLKMRLTRKIFQA